MVVTGPGKMLPMVIWGIKTRVNQLNKTFQEVHGGVGGPRIRCPGSQMPLDWVMGIHIFIWIWERFQITISEIKNTITSMTLLGMKMIQVTMPLVILNKEEMNTYEFGLFFCFSFFFVASLRPVVFSLLKFSYFYIGDLLHNKSLPILFHCQSYHHL